MCQGVCVASTHLLFFVLLIIWSYQRTQELVFLLLCPSVLLRVVHVGEGALQQQIYVWSQRDDFFLWLHTIVLEEQRVWREEGAGHKEETESGDKAETGGGRGGGGDGIRRRSHDYFCCYKPRVFGQGLQAWLLGVLVLVLIWRVLDMKVQTHEGGLVAQRSSTPSITTAAILDYKHGV